MPTHSRPHKPTASLPPCSLNACPLPRQRVRVGTPFALALLPRGCIAQVARLTSSRLYVGGCAVAQASIYERWQSALYAAHFDTTTPLNTAVGFDAHFSQLARAASALYSASAPAPSAAARGHCRPPLARRRARISTVPLHFRPRPRSVRVFTSPRLRGLAREIWSSSPERCGRRTPAATSTTEMVGRGAFSLSQSVPP
eukprot:1332758-Pleurochrysis_carterae.AAC.1